MAVPVGLDTPRTEAGNNTLLSNTNLDFSREQSFQSPSKDNNDLIRQIRNSRNPINMKTPRSRAPFADRQNVPNLPPQNEFTPLLKSITKTNALRRASKENGVPYTPSVLRGGHESSHNSPTLPVDSSGIYGADTGSSFTEHDETPAPQVGSSSTASTPLAALPKRDGEGVLTDGSNMMTLREQENIIKKIGSENWGLKLKIHFLEDQLMKAGPGFNEEALRENTDLKVDKVTMQTELRQYRKTVARAERDLEAYRQQLLELHEKTKRKHADDVRSEELARVNQMLGEKDAEVRDFRERLEAAEEDDGAIAKMKGEIGDLEADVRDKDRELEDREEEIETLKDKVDANERAINVLEDQLASSKDRVRELEEKEGGDEDEQHTLKEAREELAELQEKVESLEERAENLRSEVEQAWEEKADAVEAKEKAESDLDELRDEMANKSFTTKGLSRQLEEKSNKILDELEDLREEHSSLQRALDSEKEEKFDAVSALSKLKLRNDEALQKQSTLETQVSEISKELRNKADEKDLLQTRHDALTAESGQLQRECSQARLDLQEMEQRLKGEEGHGFEQEQALQERHQSELDNLHDEAYELRQDVEAKDRQLEAEQDKLESERRNLRMQRARAEEQAAGLKGTIERLQEMEGTLSSRETKIQEALESEKERHNREEGLLNRQVEELTAQDKARRASFDETKTELAKIRQELTMTKREESVLQERIQGLEDENVLLQNSLDEENERAKQDVSAVRQEADGLKKQLHSVKQDLSRAETAFAGAKADEQLEAQLEEVETQLSQAHKEKQGVQDQLANANIEMHTLRTRTTQVEAERDEIKSQLQNVQQEVNDSLRLDQEKLDLRRAKSKLETDLGRLGEEKRSLAEKLKALEKELDQETEKGYAEEDRLTNEIVELQRQLALATEGRDREFLSAKREGKRLQERVHELEDRERGHEGDDAFASELSTIRDELTTARNKEVEYKQREVKHKGTIRDLKVRAADLERQIHRVELSKLDVDAPRASVRGSARKDEIVEVRRQLAEAHMQITNLRAQSKEAEQEGRRALRTAGRDFESQRSSLEQDAENLEQELGESRRQQEELGVKAAAAQKSMTRLRSKVQQLEMDFQKTRLDHADRTIAEERKDLHEMLKDAKLETENLQVQMTERDLQMQSYVGKEKELRAQLKRVREERGYLTKKAHAATNELDSLQRQYERAVDKMMKAQLCWEEERKAMTQSVRFPNMSVSSVHAGDSAVVARLEKQVHERDRRHQAELKGLARQIMYLRKKYERAEGFRADLAYSKKFFLLQIEMYNACNKLDLQLIEEMGISPDRTVRDKPPKLRSVAFMVMSTIRMKKMQQRWAGTMKIKEGLLKTVEATKKKSKKGKRQARA